jgi:hypothetical protein
MTPISAIEPQILRIMNQRDVARLLFLNMEKATTEALGTTE